MDGHEEPGSPGTAPKRWGSIGGGRASTPSPPPPDRSRSRWTEVPTDTGDDDHDGERDARAVDRAPDDPSATATSNRAGSNGAESNGASSNGTDSFDVDLGVAELRDVGVVAHDPRGAPNDLDWLEPEDRPRGDFVRFDSEPPDGDWLDPAPRGPEPVEIDLSVVDLVEAESTEARPPDLRAVVSAPPDADALEPAPVTVFHPVDPRPVDRDPIEPEPTHFAPVRVLPDPSATTPIGLGDLDPRDLNGSNGTLRALEGDPEPAEPEPVAFTPVPITAPEAEPATGEPVEVTPEAGAADADADQSDPVAEDLTALAAVISDAVTTDVVTTEADAVPRTSAPEEPARPPVEPADEPVIESPFAARPFPVTPFAVKGVAAFDGPDDAPEDEHGDAETATVDPFLHPPLDAEHPLAIKGVAFAPVAPEPVPVAPIAPREPNPVDASLIGRPIGKVRPRWYRSIWFKVLIVAIIGLALLFVALSALGAGPDRLDASPPARTPKGFRLISTVDHQFAVPNSWSAQVLDEQTINSLAKRADANVAQSGDALREAATNRNISGTKTLAFNLANGDNVNLIPYRALEGDPRDAKTLAELKKSFSQDTAGATRVSVAAQPSDVHGFPAATVTVNATAKGLPMTAISTIIQTGDHVYELTVTSQSFARATVLSRQIVPTFAPR